MLAAVAAALVLVPAVFSGGYPVLASGPSGVTLRYIPNQPFAVGIVLRNRSGSALEVEDVLAVEPLGTLVHQIGTRLLPWNPPPCPKNASCPGPMLQLSPFTAATPKPRRVAAGRSIAAVLDYRLGSCSAVPLASSASPRAIVVTYAVGGTQHTEQLALGGAALLLRKPKPSDCAPRPHSDIAVTGPWAGSSAWTIPGSAGDTCTKTTFTSRWYQAPGKPEIRAVIRFPREVDVVVGIGIHGWETFRSRYAVVTTLRTDPKNYGGRFHATIAGRRGTTFRAYGAWRCQLR